MAQWYLGCDWATKLPESLTLKLGSLAECPSFFKLDGPLSGEDDLSG